MKSQGTSIVERLGHAENPRDFCDWEKREGYYVATCRVSIEDVPQLIDLASKWSDADWFDNEEEHDATFDDFDLDDLDLLPVTAWRALAELKSGESVEPLIDMLCEMDDKFDDWSSEELPHVFGKIGEPAIKPLFRIINDSGEQEHVRSIAVRGLRCVVDYYAETRDSIVTGLTERMVHATEGEPEFNSILLVVLVELEAVDAAEPIERAFASDLIDVGMMGNWEDVRRSFGVEGLGLEMPEDPYSSFKDLRVKVGIGIFSDQTIFSFGEIDEDAAQAYYERAWSLFSASNEAQEVIDRYGDLGWFRMLLEFSLTYLGKTADQLEVDGVREFVLGHVPRKVSTESDQAGSIIFELTKFWEWVDRIFELPEAKSIVEWLRTGGLVAKLEGQMSAPSNFGMAKSIFMSGKNAGYDMTSEEGMAEYLAVYNRSLQQQQETVPAPEAIVSRGPRVGRNAPCPCGSGKKYKKCCS